MTDAVNVLLAEDETHIARAIMTILKKGLPEARVDHAKNGEEAWRMLQAGDYQLIVSDWNMPKMNGDELLRALRQEARYTHTPFVMLTARGDRDSVEAALAAGADGYVIKPFKTPEFIARIKAVMSGFDGGADRSSGHGAGTDKRLVDVLVEQLKKGDVDMLPLPQVLAGVGLNCVNESTGDMVQLAESDMLLANKIVNIAGSSLLSCGCSCVSVTEAVQGIGPTWAKNYLFAIAMKEMFSYSNPTLQEFAEDLWEHSLATGYCAMLLGRELGVERSERLWLYGFMHDLGKLLLLEMIDTLAQSGRVLDRDSVVEAMAALHAESGAKLLKSWQCDEQLQLMTRYHHSPFDAQEPSPELLIVYLANLMVRRIGFGHYEQQIEHVADSAAAHKLNVDGEIIADVLVRTREQMATARRLL